MHSRWLFGISSINSITRIWVSNSNSLWVADAVDGRNPAHTSGMYKTLELMQWTRINYWWTGAGNSSINSITTPSWWNGIFCKKPIVNCWLWSCKDQFDNMSKSQERARTHVSLPEDVLPCFNYLFFTSHHNYLPKKPNIPSEFSRTFWHDKTQKRKEHSANQKKTCLIRFISLTKRFK